MTGDPNLAQALWSLAHGMVILELDDRYPEGSDLDQTWRAGAAAFERAADLRSHPAGLTDRSPGVVRSDSWTRGLSIQGLPLRLPNGG